MLGFVVVIICYLLVCFLLYILIKLFGFVSESKLLYVVIWWFFSIIIILFGVYLFLCFVGFIDFVVVIMSGIGLVGFILGFVFWDIVENFILSMLFSV